LAPRHIFKSLRTKKGELKGGGLTCAGLLGKSREVQEFWRTKACLPIVAQAKALNKKKAEDPYQGQRERSSKIKITSRKGVHGHTGLCGLYLPKAMGAI